MLVKCAIFVKFMRNPSDILYFILVMLGLHGFLLPSNLHLIGLRLTCSLVEWWRNIIVRSGRSIKILEDVKLGFMLLGGQFGKLGMISFLGINVFLPKAQSLVLRKFAKLIIPMARRMKEP